MSNPFDFAQADRQGRLAALNGLNLAQSGLRRVDQHFKLTMVASNLCRMARILFAAPQGAR